MNKIKVSITRSKKGIPCLWEEGGAYTNTGDCTCICDKDGKPKKAIYVRQRGSLACEKHALIPIRVDDYVVSANQHRGDFEIYIYKIVNINEEDADVEIVNKFSTGEWDCDVDDKFDNVIKAAKAKAEEYHCRTPYFIQV